MFKCFGCGVSGDVFAFLQRMERVPFPEAIRRAAAILGIRVGGAPAGSSVAFAKAQRQRRIQRGATIWREEEIRKHIEELRHRDELVVFAHQIYDYCDQHGVDKVLREEAVSDLLHVAYIGDKPYSLLEYEFGRLLCSDVSTAQLHREIG